MQRGSYSTICYQFQKIKKINVTKTERGEKIEIIMQEHSVHCRIVYALMHIDGYQLKKSHISFHFRSTDYEVRDI